MRLTTSKYFTPLGRQIHEKGIQPDIVVEEGRIELSANEDEELESKKSEEIFSKLENKEGETVKEEPFDYKSDNQLMRALDVIKAVKIYKKSEK